jgi:hypothetical protein
MKNKSAIYRREYQKNWSITSAGLVSFLKWNARCLRQTTLRLVYFKNLVNPPIQNIFNKLKQRCKYILKQFLDVSGWRDFPPFGVWKVEVYGFDGRGTNVSVGVRKSQNNLANLVTISEFKICGCKEDSVVVSTKSPLSWVIDQSTL